MRVKAVADGFYGGRIVKAGTRFDLDTPKHFSDSNRGGEVLGWMEIVSATPAEIKVAVAAKRLPESALEAAAPAKGEEKAPEKRQGGKKKSEKPSGDKKPEAAAEAGAGTRASDESPL